MSLSERDYMYEPKRFRKGSKHSFGNGVAEPIQREGKTKSWPVLKWLSVFCFGLFVGVFW